MGSTEIILESSQIDPIKSKLESFDVLNDRVLRILNSNFVKMTFPVFNALFDASTEYFQDKNSELREDIVDGHIIAIDLSEPMDRIVDKDEDLDFLDDYKLMNPYILNLAREPLGDIFFTGMAKAAEAVGCGNEIEDTIRDKFVKIPSWPLYYSLSKNDVKQGFDLTMEKSESYLNDARKALDKLPKNFSHREFLEFLFLTVEHYSEFWFKKLQKANIWSELATNLPK